MATVASLPRAGALPGLAGSTPSKPSLFSLVLRALRESQRLRAEAAVARYIELHGGRVTDSLEREIEKRFQQH